MQGINRRSFLGIAAAAPLAQRWAIGAPAARRYRACVIGDSRDGKYGHGMHLLWGMRDEIEVVGLADPVEEGRKKFGREAKAQRLYADYREMLEKEKPDLVAVGPRSTIHHREYLLACAAAGAHGIVEKPLAADLAVADEVIAAMAAKGLKWGMAFNFRAAPNVRQLKQQIDAGLIGEVQQLYGRGKEDHRSGGEDLIVLGTHLFDLMRYFGGAPQWGEAEIRMEGRAATRADIRQAHESLGPIVGDEIRATYALDSGVEAVFESLKKRDRDRDHWFLELKGSKGRIRIPMTVYPEVLFEPADAAAWKKLSDATALAKRDRHVGHYAPIVDDLLAAIEADRAPFTSIESGRGALAMVQAAFDAGMQGERVTFPLKRRTHPLA